jgi:hypothetical protein
MKTKLLVCLAFGIIGFLAYTTCIQSNVSAWPGGVNGYSGSINTGGQYCSSCHFISSTEKSNNFKIVSDIPTSGYVPDQVYKFSILINSKQPRAGFDIRIENADGLIAGAVANLDNKTKTQLGELTHTFNTNIENGSGKYDFTWKAPTEGGIVSVYAAVASLLGNEGSDMDTLNLFNFSLSQDISTSVSENYLNESTKDFYAFQENGNVVVRYNVSTPSVIEITLVDSKGTVSKPLFNGKTVSGTQSETFNSNELSKGIYLVKMIANGEMKTTKMVIN